MARHEAIFIEAECSQYNQKFYLRYDYAADDVWVQTYGVKEKERSARTSGQSRSIDMSQTRTGPQYRWYKKGWKRSKKTITKISRRRICTGNALDGNAV